MVSQEKMSKDRGNDCLGQTGTCKECGSPVLGYLSNCSLLYMRPQAYEEDYWASCGNLTCPNHEGEGYFQTLPDWVDPLSLPRKLQDKEHFQGATWRCKDGQEIPISKLSDDHLSNILMMLERKFEEAKAQEWLQIQTASISDVYPIYDELVKEAKSRATIYPHTQDV